MPSRHPRLRRLLLAAALALATAPAAAHAATLTTDARCYLQGAPLRMNATGLVPNAPLTVALDGQALRYRNGATPNADAAGAFASSFAVPALAPGLVQRRHALSVSDGTHKPRARFTVTRRTGADFQPSSGSPATLRARFSVWGFALDGGAPRVRVWLHWVSPGGGVRATVALGTSSGDCGALTTGLRRVFPFAPAPGRWVLVFDTHRRYRVQASGPRAKIAVHVRSLSL
ncbi:MAG TPA: hypothetical protein VFU94_14440 [Conexibacter sp.]|nr:hypothetical protein [Conexibacter sp.]